MILRTLTPFLSLIIAGILFIFVIQPQYIAVVSLRNEVDEYNNATEKYNDFMRKLEEKLAAKGSRSALDNERLDTFVFDQIDTVQLLVDLEAMAKKKNLLFGNIEVNQGDVDMKNVTDDARTVGSELETADLTFEVVGTYEQFKSFLADVEQSLTLFEVIKLELISTEESLFQQFAVTVRVYALPKS